MLFTALKRFLTAQYVKVWNVLHIVCPCSREAVEMFLTTNCVEVDRCQKYRGDYKLFIQFDLNDRHWTVRPLLSQELGDAGDVAVGPQCLVKLSNLSVYGSPIYVSPARPALRMNVSLLVDISCLLRCWSWLGALYKYFTNSSRVFPANLTLLYFCDYSSKTPLRSCVRLIPGTNGIHALGMKH